MTNEQMLAALGRLPDADLMTETKLTDPLGAGAYYRADTVVRLLAAERETCAALCETLKDSRDFPEGWGPVAEACAARIRGA